MTHVTATGAKVKPEQCLSPRDSTKQGADSSTLTSAVAVVKPPNDSSLLRSGNMRKQLEDVTIAIVVLIAVLAICVIATAKGNR